MMLIYWLFISLPVVFTFIPGYSNVLYIDSGKIGAAILGNSCTSSNEWLWMLGVSFLLLIPHILPISFRSRLAKTNPKSGGIICPKIPKISLSLRLLNIIWYIASIIGPLVWKKGISRMDLLDWIEHLGAKAAWPALFNLPIVLLPTSRLSYLMEFLHCGGTRSDMFNLHTEASILTALWIALHTILITIVYAIRDPGSFWEKMLPLTSLLGGEGIVNFMGWIAAFVMFGLWLSSRSPVISRYNDKFIIVHIILAVCFVLASNLHDYNTLMFAMLGIAEIIVDRLMRVFSRRQGASNLVVRSYSTFDSVVKVTVDNPASSSHNVGPGRHVYIQDPLISYQWHPFSISSIDDQNKRLSFHIKARGDWTNNVVSKLRLKQEDQAQQCGQSNIQIEGVYGSNLNSIYDQSTTSCIFVAGGIGITGLSEAIQSCIEQGIPCTVVWLVHSIAEMETVGKDILWNSRLLTSVTPSNTKPSFQVFVTAQEESGSSANDVDISDFNDSGDQSQTTAVHEESISSNTKLSALAVSSVVLVCIWLSFLLSRQLCCYRHSPDIDSAKSCGLASSSNSCQVCSVDDIDAHQDAEDELPCCKVSDCYLCFRALPVVMILFVAPIMGYILLFILRKYRSRYHYHTAIQELTTITEDPISSNASDMRESDHFVSEGIPYVSASNLISINYQRPDVSAVVQKLLNTHDDIAFSSCTSIVVCGPQSLLDDVSQTVQRRQQSQHSGNEYRLIVL